MTKPVTLTNTLGTQSGPNLALSTLDTNFNQLAALVNDLASYGNYYVDSGAVNAMVVTIAAPLTFTYTAGVWLDVLVAVTNTSTAVTLNVNGLGTKAVLTISGAVVPIGSLVGGSLYRVVYDGTGFRSTSAAGAAAGLLTGATLAANVVNASLAVVNPSSQSTTYEVLNSINAIKNLATYETGTFTGTYNGGTTSPTTTFFWTRNGNVVTIYLGAPFTATSNSSVFFVTGVPASLNPTKTQYLFVGDLEDNGIGGYCGYALLGTSGTIAFVIGVVASAKLLFTSGNFSVSGTKGLLGGFSITYALT